MLPELTRELAAKHRVQVGVLFEFEFLSETKRFWDGNRKITTGGRLWEASGKIISVSGIGGTARMNAQPVTFQLSGAPNDLLQVAINGAEEATGRPCAVYLQFLSAANAPLDDPVPLWAGTMDVPTFRADITERVISMGAENLFIDRIRAPYGYQTDPDQQARWPGDKGFEFAATLLHKTVNWLRS